MSDITLGYTFWVLQESAMSKENDAIVPSLLLVPESEAEEFLLPPGITELEDWEVGPVPPHLDDLELQKHRADSQVLQHVPTLLSGKTGIACVKCCKTFSGLQVSMSNLLFGSNEEGKLCFPFRSRHTCEFS